MHCSVRKMVMVLEAGAADSLLSWHSARLLESTQKKTTYYTHPHISTSSKLCSKLFCKKSYRSYRVQSWRKIDVICGLSVCVSVFPESLLRVLTKGAQCTQIIIMFFNFLFFCFFFFLCSYFEAMFRSFMPENNTVTVSRCLTKQIVICSYSSIIAIEIRSASGAAKPH